MLHHRVRSTLRDFPAEVRANVGLILFQLQLGQRHGMPHVRSMPSVGPGVSEIRVKDVSGAYRVFFVVVTDHGVLVFHAFQKKTEKTANTEIQLAQNRLREMLR
jgi:phage-related protein